MLGPLEAADLKGISTMPVADMVQASLRGLKRGTPEIRPGQSKLLWFMNRVAPNFILAQLAKPAQRMQH
jgi:short-subunit dehydrogenase